MSQQSETDFLSQVAGWSQETCAGKLDTALPIVIDQLENAAYIEDGIKILRTLCDVLLPCVGIETMEDQVFHKISKHVNVLVDEALNKIHINVTEASKCGEEKEKLSVVEECLQWIQDVGLCLESCLRRTISCGSTPTSSTLDLLRVQSLPQCALHFLRQVYSHCKESSELYGGMLEVVSESLSLLFKKAHAVQMLLLGLLEKVCVTGACLEEHVVLLCSICTGLFEVCTLVTSLDVKLSIGLWKGISRLCSQHLSVLRDRLSVCPLVTFLCEEIKQGYHYLFQLSPQARTDSLSQGDDKAFSKTVRILGFQMKVLVALLRDFCDYLGECEASVLHLLIYLHRYLPPCLGAEPLPDKQEAELRSQVVNATVPCLSHLMGSRAFRSLLTSHAAELEVEEKFPKLVLQLMVLDILPKCDDEVMDMWMKHETSGSFQPSLLSAIFTSVKECQVELKLPVMMPAVSVAAQPHRKVSLYEYLVTHICGMVGACPVRHFGMMESVVLTHALSADSLLSLLAIDCWCFLARYGTAAVCNAQVQGLISVYIKLTTRKCSLCRDKLAARLSCLLSRLVKFMSPEDQASLVQKFPPDLHPRLWLDLRPGGLTPDLSEDVQCRLVAWSLSALTPSKGAAKASQVFLSLQLLNEILSSNNHHHNSSAPYLPALTAQQQAQVLQAITDLWFTVETTTSDPGHLPTRLSERLLLSLLPVTAWLVPLMEARDLLMILRPVEAMINTPDCSPSLLVRVAKFMSAFSHVKLRASFLDCQTLERIPRVFYHLLQHWHPMVHQRALAAFSQFASVTQHEDCVPACLRGEERLVLAVQNYVNQIPHQLPDGDFQLVEYLREEDRRLRTPVEDEAGTLGLCSSDRVNEGNVDPQTVFLERQNVESGRDSHEEESLSEQPMKKRRIASESHEKPEPQPQSNNESDITSTSNTTTNTGVSNLAPAGEGEWASQFESLVERISGLSADLERACRVAPPAWFVEQALVELDRCKERISNSGGCWLDALS